MGRLYYLAKESANGRAQLFYKGVSRLLRDGSIKSLSRDAAIYPTGAALAGIHLGINHMDVGKTLREMLTYDHGRLLERIRRGVAEGDGAAFKDLSV